MFIYAGSLLFVVQLVCTAFVMIWTYGYGTLVPVSTAMTWVVTHPLFLLFALVTFMVTVRRLLYRLSDIDYDG